ncbi:MAG: hypothetical protein R3C03_23195 [Pirellulaceae bacterium]
MDQSVASLMAIVWEKLKVGRPHKPVVSLIRFWNYDLEFPEDSSTQLAERLSQAAGREIKADTTRQQLRRARVRFVEFLVSEIADGLQKRRRNW